jgi:site-specific DNA recombinase
MSLEYVFEPTQPNGTQLRALVYDRISEDPDGERENVELRLAESRAYCEDNNLAFVKAYSDDDISASKYSTKPRDGYNKLLAAVKAGAGDVIVTTEMSRLYRRLEELLDLIKLAEVTPLRRIQCTDGDYYDLSTGEGIHRAIGAVNNAMLESRKTSDRTKRKKRARAEGGWWNGGSRPFGYQLEERTGRTRTGRPYIYYVLQVDPDEAELVCEGAKRVLAGETATGIALDWAARGVTGARGGRLHAHNVRRLLTSPHVAGLRALHGKLTPGNWPAILTREVWEQVRELAELRPLPADVKRPRIAVLPGILYCHCGVAMTSHGRPAGREYECKRISGGCNGTRRKAMPIEDAVRDRALAALANPAVRAALAAELQARQAASGTVRELRERKAKDEAQLRHLRDRLADGKIDDDDFDHAKARIAERLGGIERAIAAAMPSPDASLLASLPATYPALQQAYAAAVLDRRRAILKLVVNRVTVQPITPGRRHFDAERELVFDWKV